MAPDVFANDLDIAGGIGPGCSMGGTRCCPDRLVLAEFAESAADADRVDRIACAAQVGQRPHDMRQAFHAAEAATGAPGQVAPRLLQAGEACGGDLDSHGPAVNALVDVGSVALPGAVDDPLGQRKPEREVLQVKRGREHDRMRYAVEFERDGALARQHVGVRSPFVR